LSSNIVLPLFIIQLFYWRTQSINISRQASAVSRVISFYMCKNCQKPGNLSFLLP
jgi:hypothetical protein